MTDLLIVIGVIAALIALPHLILWIKLFFFEKKLTSFCHEKGYAVERISDPLPAAFFRRQGVHWVICAGAKKYHVTFCSAPHRLREYSFISSDEILIHHVIVLKIVGKTRMFSQLLDLPIVRNSKAGRIDLNTAVPDGDEKILLFYPVAKDVTWIAPSRGKCYLGNGDLFFNDYRFFTKSGFLDELEAPGKYLRHPKPWEEY
ncbi:MAG: hypothetical protein E7580_04840 [Ruminococcaceae bacterium]|nr:hypothetical protein [Oscillospiraceae bacterium]